MKLRSGFTHFLSFMSGLGVGLLLVSFCTSYLLDVNGFNDLKLSNLMDLFTSVFVVTIVGYFLTIRLGKTERKAEFQFKLVDQLETRINDIHELALDYFDKPQKQKEKDLKRMLTGASKSLGKLLKVCEKEPILHADQSLKVAFFDYKAAITESPFGKSRPSFDSDRIDRYGRDHHVLFMKIVDCKTNLFF